MSIRHLPFLDVFEDASGGNIKTLNKDFLEDGKIPVIDQGQSVIAGYVNDPAKICKSKPPVIVFGDHTKAIKYVDFPFAMGADGTKVLMPKDGGHAKYLFYALRTLHIPDAGYSRHYKFLKETTIPLPPLAEQKRIAAILDAADALRAKRREALAQLDALLQSTFLTLFGDPVSNPMGWPRKKLGELAREKPNNGIFRKNPDYVQVGKSGLPVVWVVELFRGSSINTEESRRVIPVGTEVQKYGLKYGDVLFCRSSLKLDGIAFNNVYLGSDDEALFECHVIRISPDLTTVSPIYLNTLLRSPQMRAIAKSKSKTATMTTIDQKGLCSIEILLPPLKLQQVFAKQVAAVEKLKTSHRAHLAELDALFAVLQHRAFRGEL